jgi:alpha-D-xyloside xylohydrolase
LFGHNWNKTRVNTARRAARGLLACALTLSLPGCVAKPGEITASPGSFEREARGVVVTPASGQARRLRLQVIRPDILRVTAWPDAATDTPDSLMVTAEPREVPFEVTRDGDRVRLKTEELQAEASLADGRVRFLSAAGEPLLSTVNSGEFRPADLIFAGQRKPAYALRQAFERAPDEAYFGLGQHQHGQVNLARQNVYLTTHNLVITIPFLLSSKNYGILWDNASESRFGRPEAPDPLHEHLTLYDAEGREGALTARYFDGERLLLERREADPDYQFLASGSERQHPLPPETDGAADLRIEWEGALEARRSGPHELLMYSSGYARLSLDGELLLDRWRMNWNPWFHAARLDLVAGERKRLKVDWTPQGGYFRLLAHPPTPEMEGATMSLAAETGAAIDYYVVAGADADEVIAGYRALTGKAVLLPRWAYGFWQSRERYRTQGELLDALHEYRRRGIPIDNIVLDWSYWPVDAWGSHAFDPDHFPDPQGMVEAVHAADAQIMISVWPKFYPATGNYRALDAGGHMLNRNIEEGNRDWIAPGYLNAFYDAFDPAARALYWAQLDRQLNVYGFDAWWLDAVEPDMHSNLSWHKRKELMSPNHLGSGADVFNAYALPHAESVYLGDRAASPDTRVFILTRSGFGGIQRTASAIWSGDIVSRWSNLREQIAAGVGTAMAGMPNWTFDIGGFTPEDRFRYHQGQAVGSWQSMDPAQLAEWQELNVRWYQFGAFAPLFRAHGQNPWREIYHIAPEGSPAYASMVWHTRLRYRLLPYIYSLAGDTFHRDGTILRGLAMDFPGDPVAREVNDQYLFGPAFLVSPVYRMSARQRDVYLPEGADWYDFHSGRRFAGGQWLDAAAPLERMPLFVRAGSIVPSGPAVQHSDQVMNADLTLTVYTGADGAFELYEDDGRSYGYERGEWSRIPLRYDDVAGVLAIGRRSGAFDGMAATRRLHIRWIDGATDAAADFEAAIAASIEYDGSAATIRRESGP